MRKLLILPFLSGCVSWETVGITSTKSHNAFVDEVQEFKDDALPPLEEISEAVARNAHEHLIMAKADRDTAKVERVSVTMHMANAATKELKALEDRQFSRAEAPPFDWGALIESFIAAAMGAVGMGGPLALVMGAKLNKVKAKARQYARSTEVNEIDKDIA